MKETMNKSLLNAAWWLLCCTFALLSSAKTTADPDLWGYMAFGRLFWNTGVFPYKDVFAYLPTLDLWVYHEWLTGVLFYSIYQTIGAAGLQVIKYVVLLSTMWLMYLTALRRGADFTSAITFLFTICVALPTVSSAVRAQIFTYFFFALTLFIIECVRCSGKKKYLWFIVPVFTLWCNLHGGFVAGLGLISLYLVGELLNRNKGFFYLGIIFIFTTAATLINPYGIKYWSYIIKAIIMPRPEITEWSSFYKAYVTGSISQFEASYYVVVILFAILLLIWDRNRDIIICLIMAVTLFLGLKNVRNMFLFLILIGAYLPVTFKKFLFKMKSDHIIQRVQRFINYLDWKARCVIIIFLWFFCFLKLIISNPLSIELPGTPGISNFYYPVHAVNYIKNKNLSGNLLTAFNWGEYLLWNLYPRCRVSLDGRYETVYPDHVSREFFDFTFCRGNWREFLNKYPPDMILVESSSTLYSHLKNESAWKQVYHDSGCALFSRRNN